MAELHYAGEYILEVCEIYTTSGLVLDMTDQFASVNIYEDIYKKSLTGDISFVDTNNLITNAPIIGQEKLKLKLITPMANESEGRKVSIDFTDTPLYIYKINSKIPVNDKTTTYTLSFTTPEYIRNNRTRIQSSYEGEPSEEIIKEIIRDPELLDSKKEFFFEKTSNKFKVVGNSQRPLDFIAGLSRRCLSRDYDFAPTYLFYETVKGLFFRTLDGMMDRKNPRMVFREVTPNLMDEEDRSKGIDPSKTINNILNYEVSSAIDTMQNMRKGMYGSKLFLLDLHNKHYDTFEYNYLDDFDEDVHVDKFNAYGSQNAPLASAANDDYGNRISDYPEAAYFVQTIERDVEGGLMNPAFDGQFDYTGTDEWLLERKGRMTALNSALTLNLEVPGNTVLQAGDLIGVVLKNQHSSSSDPDPYLTGRYLVTQLRHSFVRGDGQDRHTINLTCVRDTIKQPYPSSGVTYQDGGNIIDEEIPMGDSDAGDVVF